MTDEKASVSPPTKKERTSCWNSRDKYWDCLDKNEGDESKCAHFRKDYEKFCSNIWVKHFDRKREFQKFQENYTGDPRRSLEAKLEAKVAEKENS